MIQRLANSYLRFMLGHRLLLNLLWLLSLVGGGIVIWLLFGIWGIVAYVLAGLGYVGVVLVVGRRTRRGRGAGS